MLLGGVEVDEVRDAHGQRGLALRDRRPIPVAFAGGAPRVAAKPDESVQLRGFKRCSQFGIVRLREHDLVAVANRDSSAGDPERPQVATAGTSVRECHDSA
jgi:hypothetical protein